MSYPSEWVFDGILSDILMREKCPYYYIRGWGKSKVICLPTLFYHRNVSEYFYNTEATEAIRSLIKEGEKFKLFPSDCLTLLHNGKLREISDPVVAGTEYSAVPLIPSDIDAYKVHGILLGKPIDSRNATEILTPLLSTDD